MGELGREEEEEYAEEEVVELEMGELGREEEEECVKEEMSDEDGSNEEITVLNEEDDDSSQRQSSVVSKLTKISTVKLMFENNPRIIPFYLMIKMNEWTEI